jgi:CRP-like cAMP-binding protein
MEGHEGLWCLEHIDLFARLPARERVKLRRLGRRVKYRRGETIYLPGDPSDTIFFLRKGRVKLAYLDESGKRLTLTICGRGEPFGEMALAGEERRTLIAEALENVELCAVSKDELLYFAEENPHLSLRITKLVGLRLLEIENRLEDLIFKDVHTRLARLLLRLADQYGVAVDGGIRIDLKITHKDLAELIGSTRETTSAALGEFEQQDLIEKSRGCITIRDIERLKGKAKLSG